MAKPNFIHANWPAPSHVHAGMTTRTGGISTSPYDQLNMATHVGDNPQAVATNRQLLAQQLQLPAEPLWLQQTHGTNVMLHQAGISQVSVPCADASFSNHARQVCAVLTADCLPLLVTDMAGSEVAAIHAGWRGLQQGIIEATLHQFTQSPQQLLVWLGAAIGPDDFEVGEDVYSAFTQKNPQDSCCFRAATPGHWYADMYALARQRLQRMGVTQIFGGDLSTYSDPQRFFSYRRDGECGRMAALIWFD